MTRYCAKTNYSGSEMGRESPREFLYLKYALVSPVVALSHPVHHQLQVSGYRVIGFVVVINLPAILHDFEADARCGYVTPLPNYARPSPPLPRQRRTSDRAPL